MNIPEDLKYTKTHEWVHVLGDGAAEIGLTDYAQEELGDIVFVDLPKAGDKLAAGTSFADVESVKAVSEVFSPLTGTVDSSNSAVVDAPESINADPYGAWLIKATGTFPDGELLSASEYKALL
jgi:glycine cleavage system H protein